MPHEPRSRPPPTPDEPPPWEDFDAANNGLGALYTWVQDQLDLSDNKELKDELVNYLARASAPATVDLWTAMQGEALKEAATGDRKRLSKLVWDPEKAAKAQAAADGDPDVDSRYRYRPLPLNDEVRMFIAKFLLKPSTGRGRTGRPPDPEQRLINQLIKRHVEVFEILLKRGYQDRTDGQNRTNVEIRDRAIDLVYGSHSPGSHIKRDTIANLFIKKKPKT
jgi:hypothetical protein